MLQEFSNTDNELTRCISSRMRHELNNFPRNDAAKQIVRDFMLELVTEIINEEAYLSLDTRN